MRVTLRKKEPPPSSSLSLVPNVASHYDGAESWPGLGSSGSRERESLFGRVKSRCPSHVENWERQLSGRAFVCVFVRLRGQFALWSERRIKYVQWCIMAHSEL